MDEWAKRKGWSYGTIIVDLERRAVVDVLDTHTTEGIEKWLVAHPEIHTVCRDRNGRYAKAARQGRPNARTPRHTTHHQHFPERVVITRPHHPFEGQSLEVLRKVRMPAGLHFVLILPDGSKSLIPANWTDFQSPSCAAQVPQLVGSCEDLPYGPKIGSA